MDDRPARPSIVLFPAVNGHRRLWPAVRGRFPAEHPDFPKTFPSIARGGFVEPERDVRDEGQRGQRDRRPHEPGPRPARLARHDGGDADADEREDQRLGAGAAEVTWVGTCVVVDMSGSDSSAGCPRATRSYPLHEGAVPDPTGRKKKHSTHRRAVTQQPDGSGTSPGRDAGAAGLVNDALDEVAAEPAHERPVLVRQGAERAVA